MKKLFSTYLKCLFTLQLLWLYDQDKPNYLPK